MTHARKPYVSMEFAYVAGVIFLVLMAITPFVVSGLNIVNPSWPFFGWYMDVAENVRSYAVYFLPEGGGWLALWWSLYFGIVLFVFWAALIKVIETKINASRGWYRPR